MGLVKKYKTIIPVISPEGKRNIQKLLGTTSKTGNKHYESFIQKKISKCIRDGKLYSYFPMNKKYKEDVFKSFKNKFNKFEGNVFVPYRKDTKHGTYTVGKSCKYYRLNTDWVNRYVTFKVINSPKRKIKKVKDIIKVDSHINKGIIKSLKEIKFIIKCDSEKYDLGFNSDDSSVEISLDLEKTERGYKYYDSNDNIEREIILEENENNFIKICEDYYKLYFCQIQLRFEQNYYKVFRNRYEYRLYHPLTYFPKKIYKYLRFNDEKLAEIDLSNSFPLLILNSFLNSQENDKHFLYKDSDAINFIEKVNTKESEEYLLAESIWNGKFYTYVFKKLVPDKDDSFYISNRSSFKEHMSEVLYGKRIKKTDLKTALEDKFNLFMHLIYKYKDNASKYFEENPDESIPKKLKKHNSKSDFKAGNDSLAILGMITESTIFIDKVLPKIYDKGYLALPKHDSIIMQESNLSDIKAIIKEILDIEFGKEKYSLKSKTYYE